VSLHKRHFHASALTGNDVGVSPKQFIPPAIFGDDYQRIGATPQFRAFEFPIGETMTEIQGKIVAVR
jgi:hypothetical protein